MKENISLSSKCLSSFSIRPAVNVVGVKCFPSTSPSVSSPITFIVLATAEVQGGHYSERCLDLVMGCHGLPRQTFWAEAVHLVGMLSSSTSGLGSYYLAWAPASSFGVLPMGSTGPMQSV